jgi:molecular chaperone DnaJ
MAKDFYATLGIQKNSSEQEIKQAYRKLSRELHPDKHAGDKAKEAKFKEVNEAYEVLSDATKKKNYDQFGSADFSGFGGNRGENQGGGFGGGGFQGFDASGFGGDINDIFSSFFSGGTGGRRRDDGRGRSVEIELTLSFMESVVGMKREITFRSLVTCEDCSGSGSEKGSKTVTCGDCNGMGTVTKATRSIFGTIQQSVVCESCRGSGKKPEKPCKHCNGEGRKSGDKTVHVQIPAGIDHGQSLRVQGEGEAGRSGTPAGDLLVRIRVTPDARFEREGDDIRSILPLSMIDAVLGIDASLETVHGTTKVHVPAGTQPGQVLRIKGKGMPVVNTSRHGDHYLTIDLLVPTKLSREEKKLFEELRGIKK